MKNNKNFFLNTLLFIGLFNFTYIVVSFLFMQFDLTQWGLGNYLAALIIFLGVLFLVTK